MSQYIRKTLIGLTGAALLTPAFATAAEVNADDLEVDVSMILEGFYFDQISHGNQDPQGFSSHDHSHEDGHNHGLDEGFNMGHSELALDASLGDLLDGTLLLGFNEDDVNVEEAYITTRSLPSGLQLKGGKFLSDIGYMNSRHQHDWDFANRPLVNQYLFGDHGLQETGLQLSWVPATDTYMRFGIEALQGENGTFNSFTAIAEEDHDHDHEEEEHDHAEEHAGGAYNTENGPKAFTLFAKVGPDLGPDHALQLGASAGYNRQVSRAEIHGSHAHALEGDAWFAGLDMAYRYDSGQAYGQGDWRVTSEYFHVWRNLDEYVQHEGWEERDNYRERQDGIYLEAVYGIAPRWQAGLRTEALGLTNDMAQFHPTQVNDLETSYRHSAQVTFRPAEPVFLRAQLTQNDFAMADGDRDRGLELALQVNIALGAHGAHSF